MREKIVRRVAGLMVMLSIILTLTVHVWWIGVAAFVSVNLIQSTFTGFCPLEMVLDKAGVKK